MKAHLKKIYTHLNPSTYQKMRLFYGENYESMPIDQNKIVYETRDGKSIVDSPYALFLYLASQPEYDNFRHIWIIHKDDHIIKDIIPKELRPKVDFVVRETIPYVEALLTAKYLISNSTFESFFSKRPGQVYINTWHGTPLKHMGFDIPFSVAASQNVLRNFLMTDYLLSPNPHTSKIFINGYKLDGIYPGEVLEGGYPRIDRTLNISRDEALTKMTSYGTKVTNTLPILLYTPTWKGKNVNQANDDIEQIINETLVLVDNFRGQYQVLVKVHPFIYDLVKQDERIKDYLVSDYMDANEALAATDVLVTDYSSIFFDYLVTDKPILFYVWDKDLYENERGMYLEESELPGPSAENLTELISLINNLDQSIAPYQERYQQLKERMVPYDDGHTTTRYIDYIFNQKTSEKITVHKVDSTKIKLLLYPGGMRDNGITTSFLNLTNNIDYDKYDVTVIGNPPNCKEIENNYNRMNPNVRPLFRFGVDILSAKERRINRHFMNHGVQPNKRTQYPEVAYKRETNRLTASLNFDTAIDFSGYSYFWGRYILGANAKKYCAFMHNDLYADAHREVNGQMPMLKNLSGLFTIYYRFDRLLSVSPMTMDVNKEKLQQYVIDKQMGYVVNTINIEKILGTRDEAQESIDDPDVADQNTITNLRTSRRFLTFYRDGEVKVYKNLDSITARISTPLIINDSDKVSEFARCDFCHYSYSKVSVNGMYIGWIRTTLLVERPLEIIETHNEHMIGTVSRYLNYNIWKNLGEDGKPREARTKAKYFKGQYLEVIKVCQTDRGRYGLVRYDGKTLGWMSTRPLTRIHKLALNLPVNLYFKNRAKKIHNEKRIGYSNTLIPLTMHGRIETTPFDPIIYSEPPKTTGSLIMDYDITEYADQVAHVTQVQFVDDVAYVLLKKYGKKIGYTDSRNIKMITRDEFYQQLEIEQLTPTEEDPKDQMPEDSFNFVTMGRLSPEKNQLKLIEGFFLFHQKHPNSRLYLLGKGPLRGDLQDKIEELHLEESVFLKGHLQDPFSFVKQANVFVLPSLYEGQPMVLLETLTLGMKILASNIPANVQVIGKDEKYGMLTNGTEVEDIANGMERIFNYDGTFTTFDYETYNKKAIDNFYTEINP